MDFMSDKLINGRKIRRFAIFDHFTCESLAIAFGQRMRGKEVVAVLERLACDRKLPKSIRVDNGPDLHQKF